MKFIDQEDKEKLHDLGLKIQQMKVLSQDIYDFFINDGEPVYQSTQDILDIISLYVKGEDPDHVGDCIIHSDGEKVVRLLDLLGINDKR